MDFKYFSHFYEYRLKYSELRERNFEILDYLQRTYLRQENRSKKTIFQFSIETAVLKEKAYYFCDNEFFCFHQHNDNIHKFEYNGDQSYI